MPAEVTQIETTETAPPSTEVVAPPSDAPKTEASPPEGDKAPPAAEGDGEKKGENAAPKTALEAAKAVMAKEQKPSSDGKPHEVDTQAKDKGEKPPKTAFDDPNLPFKDHPAYKEWASEHRSLKIAKKKNEEAIVEMTPKVKAHDDLVGYFSANNLTQQDVANGLNIMAAVRNDPAKAYELLKPVLDNLEAMIGVRIPADIQQKIDAGTLTAEDGQALAQARAKSGLAESRVRAVEERARRESEDRARGEQEQQAGKIEAALNEWGSQWHARDPDAAKLQPLLEPLLEAAWKTNPPRTPEEAREQADAVLAKLTERTRAFVPAPLPKGGHLPPSGAPVNTAPVPKSSIDAARAALRG